MGKFEVINGTINRPHLVCIYGVNGAGKSSLAAEAPSTVFIDVENGTGKLNVKRYPVPTSYNEFGEMLLELSEDPKVKTIAIDTADHLENLISRALCESHNAETLGDIPYGKGTMLLKEEWNKFFKVIDKIREKKNVIILAHSEIKQFDDPNQIAAYSRHQLKLSKVGIEVIKDKVDALLFFNYKTVIKIDKNTKKAKAFGGSDRAIYTEYRATHEAKNRYGLPYEIEMPQGGMWAAFEAAVAAANPDSSEVLESQITGLLTALTDEQLREKASEQFAVAKNSKDIKKLIAIKNRLLQVTQE